MNWFKEINLSQIDLDINLKAAFRVMQTKLQPIERAVFLLKDVFDVDYDTLQKTLDKNKAHCRQLLCRARKKLAEETSKIHLELPGGSALLENFRKACDIESAADLIGELKKDITDAIRKKF